MTSTPGQLIVRADDAASFRSANLAIRETVEYGIVRNISVMGCGPEMEHAASVLAGLEGVCFGLHAAINAEWAAPKWRPVLPATEVISLVDQEGTFLPHPQDLQQRGYSLLEIRSEVLAQLARVRQAGFEISYLDTHMGFDWLPGVRDVLANICAEEGLVLDSPESHPRVPGSVDSQTFSQRISSLSGCGVRVLITHPMILDSGMNPSAGVDPALHAALPGRDRERRELCSAEILRAVAASGLVLACYGFMTRRRKN